MASLQMTKSSSLEEPNKPRLSFVDTKQNVTSLENEKPRIEVADHKKPAAAEQEQEPNWGSVMNKVKVEDDSIEPLEDHHIEQMIEELLHYGSIELCSVVPPPPPQTSLI